VKKLARGPLQGRRLRTGRGWTVRLRGRDLMPVDQGHTANPQNNRHCMLYRTIRYAQYIVLWCPVRSLPMPVSAVIGLRTMICPSHKSCPCQSDKRTRTALTRHQEDPRHKVRRRENPALLSFVLCIQDAPNLKKTLLIIFWLHRQPPVSSGQPPQVSLPT